MQLLKPVTDYFNSTAEYSRAVNLELERLDPQKIVLDSDFQKCTMEAASDNIKIPGNLKKLFLRKNSFNAFSEFFLSDKRALDRYCRNIVQLNFSGFTYYDVPIYRLPEDMREETFVSQLLRKTVGRDLDGFTQSHIEEHGVEGFGGSEEGVREFYTSLAEERVTKNAIELGALIWAWNYAVPSGRGLEKTTRKAIWTGDGERALKFWQDINALRDVSGFVDDDDAPRKPPGDGDKKMNVGSGIPISGLGGPVYGGAEQPS